MPARVHCRRTWGRWKVAPLLVIQAAILGLQVATATHADPPAGHERTPEARLAEAAKAEPRETQDVASSGRNQPKAFGSKECKHGDYEQDTGRCNCYPHWATAGITDTVDFLEGVCEQYRCESDAICKEVLHIETASCPVQGWNCYCGWSWALMNYGHGYETPDGRGGGECMGVMYHFSVWATTTMLLWMKNIWKYALLAAFLLLPFGRKRSVCDHHWPSMWNGLRSCLGCRSHCPGTCVLGEQYTLDMFQDDIAWSSYVIDLAVWLYAFLLTLYVFAFFIWTFVLWVIVAALIICALIAGLCMMCGEGAASGGECSCGTCEVSCDWCLCGECFGAPSSASGAVAETFYWGGIYPYDPFWGYTGYGNLFISPYSSPDPSGCCCCDSACCSTFCRPLAWLLFVFPVLPENAWGGLMGRFVFGTHHFTPQEEMYQGGNGFIDFFAMRWRRRADLHGNESWRSQVYQFLSPNLEQAPAMNDSLSSGPTTSPLMEGHMRAYRDREVLPVGRAHAIVVNRSFSEVEDRCAPSSYEDYRRNRCWICREDNINQWDLWLSCNHLFCATCSSAMLSRGMPCPLCRVSSSTVLRGLPWTPAASPQRAPQEEALLEAVPSDSMTPTLLTPAMLAMLAKGDTISVDEYMQTVQTNRN